jgi:hypothetical protein
MTAPSLFLTVEAVPNSFPSQCQLQTESRLTPDPHETHRKVGKLTFNFTRSCRSPPVPKTWKQSAKRGCQFSWLCGSNAAIPVLQKVELHARYRPLHPVAHRQQCRCEFKQTSTGTRSGPGIGGRPVWSKSVDEPVRLLKRVFELDLEHCQNCGGELNIIAAILERPVIEKILARLGLDPQPPPRGRAREAGPHFAA